MEDVKLIINKKNITRARVDAITETMKETKQLKGLQQTAYLMKLAETIMDGSVIKAEDHLLQIRDMISIIILMAVDVSNKEGESLSFQTLFQVAMIQPDYFIKKIEQNVSKNYICEQLYQTYTLDEMKKILYAATKIIESYIYENAKKTADNTINRHTQEASMKTIMAIPYAEA